MYALSSAQMRALEDRCAEAGIRGFTLMENAGRAAALAINGTIPVKGKKCVVFCGSGNNGGDGFIVAAEMKKLGAEVQAILCFGIPKGRTAREAYEKAYAAEVPMVDLAISPYGCELAMSGVDIVVDAIFGTGFHGELPAWARAACKMINSAIAAVFALDLPSGMETDSFKADADCVRADFTVVFDSLKPSHIMPLTAKLCGNICIVDIGIPPEFKENLTYRYALVNEGLAASCLPVRAVDSNKHDHGYLLLIAGSRDYIGAAVMASEGAKRSGVGYVCVASVEEVCRTVAAKSPECVFLRLDENENGRIDLLSFGQLQKAMERATAICIGPGLGIDDDTRALVESVLEQAKCPVLLDADGINILSENINILDSVTVPVVLTPHIGEMARLLAVDSQSILNDRYELVGNFAKRYGVTVVCKGYRTFTAPAAMGAYMNTTGNAGLAKAGSGDLLSGMIGALLAQGLAPEKAAAAGVYYHGKAADLCQAELGQMYMQPMDVAHYLSRAYPKL